MVARVFRDGKFAWAAYLPERLYRSRLCIRLLKFEARWEPIDANALQPDSGAPTAFIMFERPKSRRPFCHPSISLTRQPIGGALAMPQGRL
jgi:hypothetical protein